MNHIEVDEYVVDSLMPDLTGHDRAPGAFLVYLALWAMLYRAEERTVAVSLQELAERTGLSKSAVQKSVRILKRRNLVTVTKASATAVPRYELVRHWLRRRVKRA
ncbi:MAG TPA: helix-turn-helix domain-containing protein [Bryobacteraceae bacterium]|nr:helix-turn-helix domain-containing protein [Bryobacteraceae bacterium]